MLTFNGKIDSEKVISNLITLKSNKRALSFILWLYTFFEVVNFIGVYWSVFYKNILFQSFYFKFSYLIQHVKIVWK